MLNEIYVLDIIFAENSCLSTPIVEIFEVGGDYPREPRYGI